MKLFSLLTGEQLIGPEIAGETDALPQPTSRVVGVISPQLVKLIPMSLSLTTGPGSIRASGFSQGSREARGSGREGRISSLLNPTSISRGWYRGGGGQAEPWLSSCLQAILHPAQLSPQPPAAEGAADGQRQHPSSSLILLTPPTSSRRLFLALASSPTWRELAG